ncbi:thaumatin [Absidia repens]|uniref:Thaumatin n=1 Tax=Absidia repens TaxID=90262 RepID=A0A1X2ITF3_9FUNG|nr:thaumatin [Absidia repens]
MLFSTLLSVAALAGFSIAAPTGGVQVVVKNQCDYDLTVSKLTNGASSGSSDKVSKGSSKNYALDETWQGRFFGRVSCSGTNCTTAGASDPASLAEFTFRGSGGNDFYDISFVDGFNLPMKIVPIGGSSGNSSNSSSTGYECGTPTCSSIPTCPDDMKIYTDGKYTSCQSACAKYGTDEYCCTGSYNDSDKCTSNSYSKAVKDECPSAYSYAYDDKTSTYSCVAKGYDVVFCP